MADERETNLNERQTPPPRPYDGNGALGDRPELDRLPPPAFPPGERGAKYRRSLRTRLVSRSPLNRPGPRRAKLGCLTKLSYPQRNPSSVRGPALLQTAGF